MDASDVHSDARKTFFVLRDFVVVRSLVVGFVRRQIGSVLVRQMPVVHLMNNAETNCAARKIVALDVCVATVPRAPTIIVVWSMMLRGFVYSCVARNLRWRRAHKGLPASLMGAVWGIVFVGCLKG
jgi:hypothetical protein